MNFFKLLYDLEKKGYLENARISPDEKMGFPADAIQSVYESNEKRVDIKATFFGLYGVSSVLPPFMNELALRNSASGESFRALLNIFQKRLYLLKYQIWKQGYAPFFIDSCQTSYAKLLRAISGNRLTDSNFSKNYSIAGFFGKKSHSVLNLSKICQILTGFPAKIEENITWWIPYPRQNNELRLSDNALLGEKYLDDRRLFFIKINCISVENIQRLYRDKVLFQRLKSVIDACLDPSVRYEFFLETDHRFMPACLGDKSIGLGLGATLGILTIKNKFSIKLRNCAESEHE